MTFVFRPVPRITLPVAGTAGLFPVNRIFCVGRNYAAHAREMGHDPNREAPFFFQKNPDCLVTDGTFPYPAGAQEVHHEIELAVGLQSGGFRLSPSEARACVYGYAIALDMTRRDIQAALKSAGRPWEIAKAFPASAPCSQMHRVADVGHPERGAIGLSVNGAPRQSGDLADMIWPVPELIAELSAHFVLAAGDVILTGTPEGVGAVFPGERLEAAIEGIGTLVVTVQPPVAS